MSNIAQSYIDLIPQADWCRLINLATEKQDYITNIIESDTRPRGQEKARNAYGRFIETVINNAEPLAMAA